MTEKFKIKSNLILGNLYARNAHENDLRLKQRKKAKSKEKEYYELVTKTVPGGIRQELVKVLYPITPDYVKSHASNVDYKGNLDACWNAPARGTNIKDASELQRLLSRDAESARAIIAKLQKTVSEFEKARKKQQSEVKNNEQSLSSNS